MIFIFIIIIIIMIKNNKMPCNNVSTETYTGKEQSPKRFGLSAEGFDLNFEKEGYDGKIWIVQIKNNRKVWVRKNIITKITHEEPLITNDGISEITSDSIGSIGNDRIDNDQKSEIIEEKKETREIFSSLNTSWRSDSLVPDPLTLLLMTSAK